MAKTRKRRRAIGEMLLFQGVIILGEKFNGGEEGIRTLETRLAPTPLAGERLRPLGHLSEID